MKNINSYFEISVIWLLGSKCLVKGYLLPLFFLFFSASFLVSLFNGISTFVGYLIPKPFFEKNSSGTI